MSISLSLSLSLWICVCAHASMRSPTCIQHTVMYLLTRTIDNTNMCCHICMEHGYIHRYMHINIHAYVHAYTHADNHACRPMDIHTATDLQTHRPTCRQNCIRMHSCLHANLLVPAHRQTCVRTCSVHTYGRMHERLRAHERACARAPAHMRRSACLGRALKAPMARTSSSSSAEQKTATRTVLPVPCGRVMEVRTCAGALRRVGADPSPCAPETPGQTLSVWRTWG